MFKKLFSIIFTGFLLVGCNKANPEAYRTDPILLDYKEQMSTTASSIEALKKQIDGVKKDVRSSQPQTGQAKIHTQKLYEMEGRLRALEQQLRFRKIRINTRSIEAQKEYLEAHHSNKTWPDPDQVESYFTAKRLRQAKIKWDSKSSKKEPSGHEKQASSGH